MNTTDAALGHWLRLLWGAAPGLHLDSDAPFIAGDGIHLPAQRHWLQHCAAAAHAAAHLVYSPPRFDGAALVPLARCLLALLEDARVETLAVRELPGLARLWRPLHTATPDDGCACEPLLRRLARALADPAYDDPHPWVAKGRRLFYLDEGLALPALRTPAELRSAALRLGHDIGQMRLPFNARAYRPAPAYRDDHRWMWAADRVEACAPPPRFVPVAAGAQPEPDEPVFDAAGLHTCYPEWDRLIRRLRPGWARVVEQPAAPANAAPAAIAALGVAASRRSRRPLGDPLSRQLRLPLRALARVAASRARSHEGDRLDLDALVHWRIASRLHQAADARVFRSAQRQVSRTAVCLLVDQSASTAAGFEPAGGSVLQAAARAAAAMAQGLQALGVPCAVVAFHSNGRHAVRLRWVKSMSNAVDAGLAPRLHALRSAGSTRLGAALRHTTALLGALRADARWVLVLSDGEPHDVDMHDPQYLVDDARHAVQAAARRAVRVVCVALAPQTAHSGASARHIFGPRGVHVLGTLGRLPQALARLLG